jgi:hypothetical protein
VAALFEALGLARNEPERALLAGLSNVTLRNWRGIEVGRLAAEPDLRRKMHHAGA